MRISFRSFITQTLILPLLIPFQNSFAQDKLEKTFVWYHDGYQFTQTLSFDRDDYKYYKSLSKFKPYNEYATQHNSHKYFKELAAKLDEDARDLGYTGVEVIEYLTSFVQQGIVYTADHTITDYPKYPIESLVEQKGDCEDKAALLVALLKTFGFDAVMVLFSDHMAVAVNCEYEGGYYDHNGKRYFFIETSQPNWDIGQLTPQSKESEATLLDVKTTASYERPTDTYDDPVYTYSPDELYNDTPAVSYSDNSPSADSDETHLSNIDIILSGKTVNTDDIFGP